MKKLIVYIFIVFFVSCYPKNECLENGGHVILTFTNNSNKKVLYIMYGNYPDTSIGDYNPFFDGTKGHAPGVSIKFGGSKSSCWEEYLMNSKKEWFYIFDYDSLAVIPWDTVRATQRGLLERREFDLNYLQQHNWTITYP